MPLFDFILKPLQDIEPWGSPDDPNLHWFGLTDGWYSIAVGSHRLFEYTPDLLNRWRPTWPDVGQPVPWPDYQVVRLYEDIFDIAPAVIRPLPDELWKFVRDLDYINEWEKLRSKAMLAIPDDGEEHEKCWQEYELATSWWSNHFLWSGHLSGGPSIWFARHQNQVSISWDNTECTIDNLKTWTADRGKLVMAVSDFKSELRSLHDRLMTQMAERIAILQKDNPLSGVRIDMDALLFEHSQRERWTDPESVYLAELPPVDEILSAIERMQNWASRAPMQSSGFALYHGALKTGR